MFAQLINIGLTKIALLRLKRHFTLFLDFINHGLKKFSLMPQQVHMHIDLVVEFINLGLTKCLRPQDAVRALYSGLNGGL